MKKQGLSFVVLFLAALLLTGCGMHTVEEMYALPKRSRQYSQLQTTIDSAMVGLTYSAPVSGENQQSVQMADLDGDGLEEYLVFARGSSATPLQVLVFSQEEDGCCRLTDVIESAGLAFEQVEYVEFDERPGCELVIGRRVSDQVLRRVAVYNFSSGNADLLLMNSYSKFLACDLNEDGRSELMVLRPSEAETERGMAVLYGVQNGEIFRSVETELSQNPSQIRRITASRLHGGLPAVYVTSSALEDSIVTDIFAMKDQQFTNVSYSAEADTSIQTLQNFYVYAEDIDEDGILELPSLLTMKSVYRWGEDEQKFLLRWFAMDPEGREVDKLYTFHYYPGGWYIQLDSDWASRVTVDQNEGTYTFYVWDDSYQQATAVFTLFIFTGENRDEEALQDGRFPLYRAEGVAYSAKLEPNAAQFGITEEHLIESFRLIHQDWRTGET